MPFHRIPKKSDDRGRKQAMLWSGAMVMVFFSSILFGDDPKTIPAMEREKRDKPIELFFDDQPRPLFSKFKGVPADWRYYLSGNKEGYWLKLGSYANRPSPNNPLYDSLGLTKLNFGDIFGVVDRLQLFTHNKELHCCLLDDVTEEVEPRFRPKPKHRIINTLERDKQLFVNLKLRSSGSVAVKEVREEKNAMTEEKSYVARIAITAPALHPLPDAKLNTDTPPRDPVEKDYRVGDFLETEFQSYQITNIVPRQTVKIRDTEYRLVGWIEINPEPLDSKHASAQ